MSAEERRRAMAGLVLFTALAFLGSWFIAASLRALGVAVAPTALPTRLLTTSLLYTVTMGWQPIIATWVVRRWVDPPDALDLGLRPSRQVFSLVGGLGALGLVAAATGVAFLFASLGLTPPLHSPGPTAPALAAPSGWGLVALSGALFVTIALVWVQAFAEEVGWRGYFLPRAMERFGRWRGLLLHGAVWGLWYAPVLFFASVGSLDPFTSLGRSGGFIVTCALLGTLFGWLRLASRSLVPVVLANTTLTLAAGLPWVLGGLDAGDGSATFGPPGWLVLLVVIGALLLSRWRSVVHVPIHADVTLEPAAALSVRLWLAMNARAARAPERN